MDIRYSFAVLMSFLACCYSLDNIEITNPIEGVEGQTVTIYCISNVPTVITGNALRIQVGSAELPSTRRTYGSNNMTHREVQLLNLDRQDFVTLDQAGDNGMPLVCAFANAKSNVSVVTVFYNNFASLFLNAAVGNGNGNTITVVVGGSVRVPLNISANPLAEPVITRSDGLAVSSSVQINSSAFTISQAGREIAGSYNVTVSNVAGVISFSINIEVQFAPQLTASREDFCELKSNSSTARALECLGKVGSEVRLSCAYEAVPAGTLKASYNGMELSSVGASNLALDGDTIVITNFNLAAAGEYKCMISNVIEGTTRNATITFQLNGATPLFQHGMTLYVLLLVAVFLLVL